MPVEQLPSRPSDAGKLVQYNDYIDAKIQSTRRMVKVVDLATTLVALAAAVLVFLLLAAIVEHWLVPGGFSFAARTVLFALLMGGVLCFAYRRLWPLCVRAINPVYAAQTIEHSSPSLKNSLINLLLFRQRRSDIADAVYRTLEEQAAQRLTRVPVETAVDRSHLIHLGYVLIAVVAVAGLYKVFSPKDPLVTAERVLMPWADIVPASRVSISAIKPGGLTISRGEFVDVSAEVRGLNDDEEVLLRYTTEDGQVVGKSIPMKPSTDGLQFTCRLSDAADGADNVGLTRNLRYRLEAGDARSLDYTIQVVAAPSILVERVDYDYPAYTGYVDRSVDGIGDVRAIEGTRVTIHARANGPIREADVDFDADGRRDLRMTATESEARASFELALREDRQTPRHASYVLRFTNAEGRVNHDPVKHSINVEPDFEPEAAIRLPQERALDARLDEKVAIEVEARDPDFALSAVRLRGEAAGRAVIDESLLKREQRGRFTARYIVTPSAHGLKAGDVVEYWIEAADNRTPKPNLTATDHKLLRIVSQNPVQQPPPDRIARNDRQQPQPGERQQDGKQGAGNQGGNAGEQQRGEQGGQGEPGENKRDEQQQRDGKQQGKSSERDDSGSANEAQPNNGDAKRGANDSRKQAEGSDKGGDENQSGGRGQGGQQSKSNETKSGQQKSNGEQTGAGAAGGESSKDGPQPDGARPDINRGSRSETGRQQNGQQQAKPNEEQSPVSSEGDNDAEAFDRIQRHLEQKGELKDDKNSTDSNEFSREAKPSAEQGQGAKESGRQGDSPRPEDTKPKPEQSDKSASNEGASPDGKAGTAPRNGAEPQESGKSNEPGKGPGAETRGDDLPQPKEQKGDPQEQSKSPGGEQTASKGPAGAGNEQKPQGAPNSRPDMRPAQKREQPQSSQEKTNEQEPPAADGQSKRESDSQGDEGGDISGGGEEGGGQKAPREGTGSAGQHQSSDEGAGESAEKGKGDNSPNAGRDAKSDHKTGASSGDTPGEGSKQREGTGDKPGGTAGGGDDPARNQQQPFSREAEPSAEPRQGDKETRRQGEKDGGEQHDKDSGKQGAKQSGKQQDANAEKRKGDANNNVPGGASGGGGQPGGAENAAPSITGEAPEGDAANLDYARKQTELVLDKLSDQLNKKQVDKRLLKELGWTEEDLRRFVERWQQRKGAAERNDPSGDVAKRELDDALRSLGLRRGELQQSAAKKDSLRDLREGYRGPVPPGYQERLRAYNQGVSRARQDGE